MQVDPTKAKLKLPGSKRLQLKCDVLLSKIAFTFNLCRYTVGITTVYPRGRHYIGEDKHCLDTVFDTVWQKIGGTQAKNRIDKKEVRINYMIFIRPQLHESIHGPDDAGPYTTCYPS